jgi:hypothetical protein
VIKYATWHDRISKAWRKKVKRKRPKPLSPPKEVTIRWQEGVRVMLAIWDDRHLWRIVPMRDGKPAWMKTIDIRVDTPLSQDELFRWLEKTTPIE